MSRKVAGTWIHRQSHLVKGFVSKAGLMVVSQDSFFVTLMPLLHTHIDAAKAISSNSSPKHHSVTTVQMIFSTNIHT